MRTGRVPDHKELKEHKSGRGRVDKRRTQCDNFLMSTQKLDSEKRIVLPDGRPGDVFEIQPQGEGRFLLVRQVQAELPGKNKTREERLEAIRNSRIRMTMSWEELRKITRDQ